MIKKLKKSSRATVMSLSLIFFSSTVSPNEAEAFNLKDTENIIKIIGALNSLNVTNIPIPKNNIYKACAKDRYFKMESIKRDYNLSTLGKKRQYKAIDQTYDDCIGIVDRERNLTGYLDTLNHNYSTSRINKGAEISFSIEIKF